MVAILSFADIPLNALPGLTLEDGLIAVADVLIATGGSSLPVMTGDGELMAAGMRELLQSMAQGLSSLPRERCKPVRFVNLPCRVGDQLSLEALRDDHVFVVQDGGRTLGYVAARELMLHGVSGGSGQVGTVADRTGHVVMEGTHTVYQAHKRLFESKRRVIVTVDVAGHPVGVFRDKDVSALIEKGCDIWSTKLESVANPVDTIAASAPLDVACLRFMATGTPCLVVVDDQGVPTALLWRKDVVPESFSNIGSGMCEPPRCLPAVDGRKADQADFLDSLLSTSFKSGIIGTDEHLNIIYFNAAARSMLEDDLRLHLGSTVWMVSDAFRISREELADALSGARNGEERVINSWRMDGGVKRFLQCRVSRVSNLGHVAGYVLSIQDVTSQRNAEAAIMKLAYYDRLTQLPNRLLFEERLDLELRRCRRNTCRFAVMMVDLDGFKQVNDRLGHLQGDELLRQVAVRLGTNVRESDTVARFGGDEFVFLLPEVDDQNAALALAVKMQQVVAAPYMIEGNEVVVSGSVGVAVYPDDGEACEALLQLADDRMFINKRTGELIPPAGADLSDQEEGYDTRLENDQGQVAG